MVAVRAEECSSLPGVASAGLVVPVSPPSPSPPREQVDQAHWDDQRHLLALTGLTPAVAAHTLLRLARPWDLPAVASERVTWARLVDRRVWLNGRAGARMVARRAPGQPSITWLVILDHGLDPADPAVRAAAESALTDLRAETGADAAAAG